MMKSMAKMLTQHRTKEKPKRSLQTLVDEPLIQQYPKAMIQEATV